MTSAFEDALLSGAGAIGVELTAAEVDRSAAHFASVLRWNKVHNLTRVTDPVETAARHYLDAFAGFSLLESRLDDEARREVVDVGSGAGYPGIIGAIRWPSSSWTLLDSAAKRCSFLDLVARDLGLTNVIVRHADARKETERWPLVVSRATFSAGHLEAALNLRTGSGHAALWVGAGDVGDIPTSVDVLTLGTTTVVLR